MKDRFESFSKHEKEILFESLIYCLRSNSGVGCKGYDQGHLVYSLGARMGSNESMEDADGPDMNDMYLLLKNLSLHMVDSDSVTALRKYFVTDWKRFCELVYSADRHHGRKYTLPPFYDDDFEYK